MKEELKSLGFREKALEYYFLNVNEESVIHVNIMIKKVYITDNVFYDSVYLFPYDLEKLKTLINLLK